MSDLTSARLTELLRMRRFLDAEIADERRRLALDPSLRILSAACDLYGTAVDVVRGDARDTQTVKARHLTCWMLREVGMTLEQIGRAVNRDHTSVMYAVRAIERDPARKALGQQLLAQEEGAA